MAAWPKPGHTKVLNGEFSRKAKVELRAHVLETLGASSAHVLDVFCGPVGEMHASVWTRAASYVGVDTAWRKDDARARFAAPAAMVLRSIDLQPFNVFDVDAFGSPWTEAIIVAARRRWAPGERGAIVLTDGSDMKLRFVRVKSVTELVGPAHHRTLRQPMQRAALAAWCSRAGVVREHVWVASGASNRLGGVRMVYTAVIFRGAATQRAVASAAASPG